MKNFKTRMVLFVTVVFACSILVKATSGQKAGEWVVPANYKTMKNPAQANKENIANGKDMYAKHCKSCHGSMGLGDGPKAASLDVSCGDFTSAKFQAEADGELFYKISEGRDKMPAFKKSIPEANDRWAIVDYLRTFGAKK
jgi:mono/diheme cytochrome c family protein